MNPVIRLRFKLGYIKTVKRGYIKKEIVMVRISRKTLRLTHTNFFIADKY